MKRLFTSCFGLGYLPIAPGTWGSLPPAILFYLLGQLHVAPMVIAAVIVVVYTPILLKIRFAEFFPGLSFGPLLVIGSYITQLPKNYVGMLTIPVIASIPVGLLVSNLLFLNEFPDYEADSNTGRRHGVILLGRKRASKIYVLILGLTFMSIIVPVILTIFPLTVLISLVTLPLAVKASKNVLRSYDNPNKMMPSLAQNSLIVLITPFLLALGLTLKLFI